MDMLPYSELSAGTVLLSPSLLLRSPTITSIKNVMNGNVMNGTVSSKTFFRVRLKYKLSLLTYTITFLAVDIYEL